MALKVKLPSGMKEIDTVVHRPVTFVGGVKKVLFKAVTFVNGVKKVLWGDFPIDYIAINSVACGNMYAIGDTWMHTSLGDNTLQFDISNLSDPTLVQSISWGNVFQWSGYQSSGNSMVFGSTKGNKISVNGTTGVVSVVTTYAYPSNAEGFVGVTDEYVCTLINLYTSNHVVKGNGVYWNTTNTYSIGGVMGHGTHYNNTPCIQVDTNTILVNMDSDATTRIGLYTLTPDSYTKVANQMNDLLCLDNGYLLGVTNYSANDTSSVFNLYDPSDYTVVQTYTHADPTETIKLLGRMGENYYFISCPKNISATSGVKVFLLNKDDLTTFYTQDLPSDPFNENGGAVTFWRNCTVNPLTSTSGYLGASTYSNASFRCVRIGQLL